MQTLPQFVELRTEKCSIIIDCRRNTPVIMYFAEALKQHSQPDMLALLSTRQEAKCAVVEEVPLSLSPCLGDGFTGHPGISLHNDGIAWSVSAKLVEVSQANAQQVTFTSLDSTRNIQLQHELVLDAQSHVLCASTKVTNLATAPLVVNDCAAPTVAIADNLTKITSFEGRWSNEFQRQPIDLFLGAFVRENRKGKTSHDNFPGVLLHEPTATEYQGECMGFHLGWSGNHRTRVELLPEQRTYVQMAELLGSQEVVLKQHDSYTSPILYVSFSATGFTQLSQQFHRFVRSNMLSEQVRHAPRMVHYNTWEGIYFNHETNTLKTLADIVANVGAERFVLDDGWFKGRRGDKAGLGDWLVDSAIYPQGLSPLISHVKDLGMAFGIWFEPEMVNPDSDLYRAHPDWILQTQNNQQLRFRNQYVLDLTRIEVVDYLFKQIDDVLSEYPDITYIKWDMNRDINHAGDAQGISAVHNQTLAVYRLIDRVKQAHPQLEIESCSSGGARIDFGVLAHTDRVWTSDSNDALDRLSIQRGCSFFFPSNIMGSHVGPRDCHITGRRISIEMRIATALFGHMGMEMDPRELSEHEVEMLKQGIALYKQQRHLIHSGELFRLDDNGLSIDFGIVAENKSEALFAYNSVTETRRTVPNMYRFKGLDPDALYRLNRVWPPTLKEYSPSVLPIIEDQVFSGQILMRFGMQLAVLFPQTSLIFKLDKMLDA